MMISWLPTKPKQIENYDQFSLHYKHHHTYFKILFFRKPGRPFKHSQPETNTLHIFTSNKNIYHAKSKHLNWDWMKKNWVIYFYLKISTIINTKLRHNLNTYLKDCCHIGLVSCVRTFKRMLQQSLYPWWSISIPHHF